MHWATQYIGKPWRNGARGPEQFDCWGLLWWIYDKHLGITLPLYPSLDAKDVVTVNQLITGHAGAPSSNLWHRLSAPTDLCAVAMGTNGVFTHVGLYLAADGGLVLHCADGHSVVAQKVSVLRSRLRLEFYRWQP